MIRTKILLPLLLLLAACASTPQASRQADAEAKTFTTDPGSAAIYVYRTPFDELRNLSTLYMDGRLIGSTLPGAYFRIEALPGKHTLHGVGIDTGQLTLETRPGELYFVELQVTSDVSQFRQVSDAVGRQRIRQCCALLENWAPGQRPLLR